MMQKRINWRLTAIKYVQHVIRVLHRLRDFSPVYTYTNPDMPFTVELEQDEPERDV